MSRWECERLTSCRTERLDGSQENAWILATEKLLPRPSVLGLELGLGAGLAASASDDFKFPTLADSLVGWKGRGY